MIVGSRLPPGVYDRESTAMNAGIAAYRRSVKKEGSQAMLRRNVHRLEKGLLMQPRRDLFATAYIDETVVALQQASKRADTCPEEIAWASDVIRRYFEVTRDDPDTYNARKQFTDIEDTLPAASNALPYRRLPVGSNIGTFRQLLELANHRRSVRWFLSKPVPRELIEQAMLVAREAPSSCNRQPFVFRVFDAPDSVREVAEIPMGAAGFSHQIPVLIVVIGQQRHFSDPRDRHVIYIDGALAGMSFVLALEALGLSSCILNWPDIADREEAMRTTMDLSPDERPVFLIAVGYGDPEGLVARSCKRPVSEVLQFEPLRKDK